MHPEFRLEKNRLSLVITCACFFISQHVSKGRCADEHFSVDFSYKQNFPLRLSCGEIRIQIQEPLTKLKPGQKA